MLTAIDRLDLVPEPKIIEIICHIMADKVNNNYSNLAFIDSIIVANDDIRK